MLPKGELTREQTSTRGAAGRKQVRSSDMIISYKDFKRLKGDSCNGLLKKSNEVFFFVF